MLVRLLYASRCNGPVTADLIEGILTTSRQNNPALGVTGLLCHSGDFFMQLLEGGRDVVNTLYGKIITDPRHRQVVLLDYEEITERRFAAWTMGQVNLCRLNPSTLLKYAERPELDPYVIPGKMSLALLDELVATASVICRTG